MSMQIEIKANKPEDQPKADIIQHAVNEFIRNKILEAMLYGYPDKDDKDLFSGHGA